MNTLAPVLTLALGMAALRTPAHADEWSVVPLNDPIYRQLAVIGQFGDGKTSKTPKGLTRYEAALQVARTITFSGTEPSKLPRAGWRALQGLVQELRPELTQLGVDVSEALATCDKNLAPPAPKAGTGTSAPSTALPGGVTGSLSLLHTGNPFLSAPGSGSALLSSAGVSEQDAVLGLSNSAFQLPLSSRLRLNAVALTLGATPGALAGGSAPRNLGGSTDIAYDLNSWLTFHANTTQRILSGDPSRAPLFSAPLFNGATQAQGAGGGVAVNMGWLSLSGGVESLGTDTGERGTITTGGIGLKPGDRLSLSAQLSRLRSADRSAPASMGTQFGLAYGLTNRLSLNMLYQSMFTQQSTNNASRFSGGVSLSF